MAVFLIPAVQILSWAVTPALPLSFRPVEIGALAGATASSRRSSSPADARAACAASLLIAAYVGVAVAFFFAGDRRE